MENKNSKLNTILLLILIVIGGFIVWKISFPSVVYVPTPSEEEKNPVVEPKKESVKTLPNSIRIILSNFLSRHPYAVSILECNKEGERIFVTNETAYDGGNTFYNSSGAQLEACGSFGPEQPSEDSLCKTLLPSCDVVFENQGYPEETPEIDIYNLK